MKIDNYAFVRVWCSNQKVARLTTEKDNSENPENSSYYVALLGECYGREGFKDGAHIHTSAIKEVTNDGKAVTFSGSVYELGCKNPGYIAFEKAVSEGLTIVRDWTIGSFKDNDSVYLEGETEFPEYDFFRKKIVAQEGPVITVVDWVKVFVDWISINALQLWHLACEKKRGYLKGKNFCFVAFEPDIFANNWKFGRAGGTCTLT